MIKEKANKEAEFVEENGKRERERRTIKNI